MAKPLPTSRPGHSRREKLSLAEASLHFAFALGTDDLCRVLVSPSQTLAELLRGEGARVYLL